VQKTRDFVYGKSKGMVCKKMRFAQGTGIFWKKHTTKLGKFWLENEQISRDMQ